MIRSTTVKTKRSGGPCGIDVNGFRGILACKSFKQSSVKLWDEILMLAKRLCTTYIDPDSIEACLLTVLHLLIRETDLLDRLEWEK